MRGKKKISPKYITVFKLEFSKVSSGVAGKIQAFKKLMCIHINLKYYTCSSFVTNQQTYGAGASMCITVDRRMMKKKKNDLNVYMYAQ